MLNALQAIKYDISFQMPIECRITMKLSTIYIYMKSKIHQYNR